MKKEFEDLYVLDIIEVMDTYGSITTKIETSSISKNHICKKQTNSKKEIYRDLENNYHYKVVDELGYDRIEESSITPLENYYRLRWILQNLQLKEIKDVHKKVRSLSKKGKI